MNRVFQPRDWSALEGGGGQADLGWRTTSDPTNTVALTPLAALYAYGPTTKRVSTSSEGREQARRYGADYWDADVNEV